MPIADWFRPSIRAARLFLIAARGGRRGAFARSMLITLHSCDVSPGAQFDGPPILPHPFGIVVGKGAVVGRNVKIWQGVTIGSNGREGYPTIKSDCRLLPYCTIVGDIEIGAGASIGTHAVVVKGVPPGQVFKGIASAGDGTPLASARR
jgi:serine O-acetyltransferase